MKSQGILAKALTQHLRIVRTYPAAALIALASGLIALYFGYAGHRMRQAVGYLCAVWLCAFLVDLVVNARPKRAIGFPIRYGAVKESLVTLGCTLLGLVFLVVRFAGSQWNAMPPTSRLLWLPLLFFTYPVFLALIYLCYYRYKPSELGANLRYWYLPLLLHPVWGAITFAVAPDRIHWHSYIHENGIAGVFWTGLICAALSEEFVRMLLQTRLGAALHNDGLGFVAASFIWASLHIPVTLAGSPGKSVWQVALGCWALMPLGLLWGYLTHRTKSLVPSVFMHGLNLWGLQNI